MNKVSPILDDEIESSVDTMQKRYEIKVQRVPYYQQVTGPRTCRICLEEEMTFTGDIQQNEELLDKEMIIPCECRGSVGFVHQKCIKMWIQKQHQGSKIKRAYCQICKSEIFFKNTKIRYCDCNLGNLCQTSSCNWVCVVAELILIGVVAIVQYYVDHLMNFQLLRNTLLALLGILCFTFILTIFLIIKQSFIKSYKEIQRIYSVGESQQLGLREPFCKSQNYQFNQTCKKRRHISVDRTSRRSKFSQTSHRPITPFVSISPELITDIS